MRFNRESTTTRPAGRHSGAPESRRLNGPAGDIMLAARVLFEERGVGKTTVKDIAAEANVIYLHRYLTGLVPKLPV